MRKAPWLAMAALLVLATGKTHPSLPVTWVAGTSAPLPAAPAQPGR